MAKANAQSFVLVHGAWHGGWCWRRVADLLTACGYKTYTPTLTGLGERCHLMSESIDLDTHIADVVNLIRWEELDDIVLVGHSYAGWVISGVAEQVPEKIASIVFLDAFVPENGQRGVNLQPPQVREAVFAAAQAGRMSRAAPPAAAFGVNEKDRAWVDAKMTPQPIAVSLQPLRLTGARDRIPKKAYIRATAYPSAQFDAHHARLQSDPSWRVLEMPCGHDVMIDMPEQLASVLLQLA